MERVPLQWFSAGSVQLTRLSLPLPDIQLVNTYECFLFWNLSQTCPFPSSWPHRSQPVTPDYHRSNLPQSHPSHHRHLKLSQVLFSSYRVEKFTRTKGGRWEVREQSPKEMKLGPVEGEVVLLQLAAQDTTQTCWVLAWRFLQENKNMHRQLGCQLDGLVKLASFPTDTSNSPIRKQPKI